MNDNFDPTRPENKALLATVDWDSGGVFPNRKAVRLDPVTHSLLVLDYPHHEIHVGEHHVQVASALLGNGATLDVLFKSPLVTGHVLDTTTRRKAHTEIIVESALASTTRLYKNSTKTFIPGNVLAPWNRNFHAFAASEGYYTSPMSICTGTGGTEDSTTLLGPVYLGSTNQSGKVTIGGAAGGRNEFILEPDDWYRIEIVSRVADNSGTIWIDWYEHAEQTNITG